MLSVRSCSYRYPGADRWAFHDIDLSIFPGEIIYLRGRNGSGKSTLLKVICRLLEPTQGRVVTDSDASPIYMDQAADQMLAFDLTVHEQLSAFRDGTSDRTANDANQLRDFGLDLELRMNEFVGHLSGGQRQIVALMTIVGSGANILCLDEFLSALDTHSAAVAENVISALVMTKKISVLAVSHSTSNLRFDREITLDAA
jgi:ABC-type bacteriocin/lantibiotic exporter with double-glycine peptidase domain